jgi:hypothetical protein
MYDKLCNIHEIEHFLYELDAKIDKISWTFRDYCANKHTLIEKLIIAAHFMEGVHHFLITKLSSFGFGRKGWLVGNVIKVLNKLSSLVLNLVKIVSIT